MENHLEHTIVTTGELTDAAFAAVTEAQRLLEQLIAAPEPADSRRWIAEVQQIATALHDALVAHTEQSEGWDGLLADATGRKPALLPESAYLAEEHLEMTARARDLVHEAETQAAFQDFDVEMIRLKAVVLRDMVAVHVHRSGSLTYESSYRVEGGEGG